MAQDKLTLNSWCQVLPTTGTMYWREDWRNHASRLSLMTLPPHPGHLQNALTGLTPINDFRFLLQGETPWPKAACRGNSLFYPTLPGNSLSLGEVRAGTQCRELKQSLGGYSSLVCSTCFLLHIQDHGSRGGTASRGLSPPTSVINQENAPHVKIVRSLLSEVPLLKWWW